MAKLRTKVGKKKKDRKPGEGLKPINHYVVLSGILNVNGIRWEISSVFSDLACQKSFEFIGMNQKGQIMMI